MVVICKCSECVRLVLLWQKNKSVGSDSSSWSTVTDKHLVSSYVSRKSATKFCPDYIFCICIIVTWWDEPGEIESYLDN